MESAAMPAQIDQPSQYEPAPSPLSESRAVLETMPRRDLRTRVLSIILATVALVGVTAPVRSEAHRETMVCENPASGATWELRIDLDRATVDTSPANVTDTSIAWHDAKDGGNYTLDRKTGALSAVFASSTGGYFLHDRCAPKYSR